MDKKIKNKHIQRIMSVLSVALTLSLVFVISCSASDTFSTQSKVTNPDYLISRAVVNSPRDYGVNAGTQFVLDNYNSIGLNTSVENFQNVKYTGYINYPFNNVANGYDSNGRLWASFLTIRDQNGLLFDAPRQWQNNIETYACVEPVVSTAVQSSTPNRCTLGGRSVDLYFDDIEYVYDNDAYYESKFAFSPLLVCSSSLVQDGYQYLKVTVSYTVVYDSALDNSNALFTKEHSYVEYIPYTVNEIDLGKVECSARHIIATNNTLLRKAEIGTNDCVITNLHINYDYLVDSVGESAGYTNYRVYQVATQSTVDNDSIFIDVSSVNDYDDNVLAKLLTKTKIYIVEGLDNVSFTGWLENAVGGFFDFEIVPNISFGGILLLCLTVGIVMLLIRIFRG